MSEKLTKTAIKAELTRRIEWFEKAYKFSEGSDEIGRFESNPALAIHYGRYLALTDMRWQIEKQLFVGGYAA